MSWDFSPSCLSSLTGFKFIPMMCVETCTSAVGFVESDFGLLLLENPKQAFGLE